MSRKYEEKVTIARELLAELDVFKNAVTLVALRHAMSPEVVLDELLDVESVRLLRQVAERP